MYQTIYGNSWETIYKECSKTVKPDWIGTEKITHIPRAFLFSYHVICVDCYTEECMSHPDFDVDKYTQELEDIRDRGL